MAAVAHADETADIGDRRALEARHVLLQELGLGIDKTSQLPLGPGVVVGVVVHVQGPLVGNVLPQHEGAVVCDRAHVDGRVADVGVAVDAGAGHARPVETGGKIAGGRRLRHRLLQQWIVGRLLVAAQPREIDAGHGPQQPAGDRPLDAVPAHRTFGLAAAAAYERSASAGDQPAGS